MPLPIEAPRTCDELVRCCTVLGQMTAQEGFGASLDGLVDNCLQAVNRNDSLVCTMTFQMVEVGVSSVADATLPSECE